MAVPRTTCPTISGRSCRGHVPRVDQKFSHVTTIFAAKQESRFAEKLLLAGMFCVQEETHFEPVVVVPLVCVTMSHGK